MSSNDDWQEIENNLSQLLEDEGLVSFRPLLEKLKQCLSAQVYPPDIFTAFIELVQRMRTDFQHGRSIHDLLEQAISGKYVQPDWDVHSVFQANGHVFQFVLSDFQNKIEPEKPGKPLPIVLIVMNAKEAQDLASGNAFLGYPDQLSKDFQELRVLLDKHGVVDWVKRYRETPEGWQPFGNTDGGKNIEQLVTQALSMLKSYAQPFIPLFQDIRTLNSTENRFHLRELRQNGCVIIMDCISMRHPAILRAFQQSALDVYTRTSIVTIAPVHSVFEIMREMTIVLQLRISDMEFAKRRLDHHEEFGACREISSKQEFQHWLIDRVRKMYPVEQTGIRPHMFKGFHNK